MTVQISNPEDIRRINKALREISDELTIIAGHKDQIKAIKDTLLEEFKDKLTSKQINKLAKTYHNQNYDREVAEHEEFQYLFETITQKKDSE